MRVTVVDASAIAAILFDEPEAEPIAASVSGKLIAPSLLRYELASVCTTKLIRHPARSQEIESRYALLDKLDIEYVEPEWSRLPSIARRWSLSAYDATYLHISLAMRAPLVTLDARLAAAYDNATTASL